MLQAVLFNILRERDVGFPAGPVRVPIVPAAVIFDLGVGDAKVRPDREMGYQACLNATGEPGRNGLPLVQGQVPLLVKHRVFHLLQGVSVQRVNISIPV